MTNDEQIDSLADRAEGLSEQLAKAERRSTWAGMMETHDLVELVGLEDIRRVLARPDVKPVQAPGYGAHVTGETVQMSWRVLAWVPKVTP